MTLSKEKIIEAAQVFNQSKNFNEFKIKLDLCNIELKDFENDYYELVASIYPIYMNLLCNRTTVFNLKTYMALNPKKIIKQPRPLISDRFKLPEWFYKDEFGTVIAIIDGQEKIVYSPEFILDMEKFGIDSDKEMMYILMHELASI